MTENKLLDEHQRLIDITHAEHDGRLGRFHRYEGNDAYIIVEHKGEDVRITVPQSDIESLGEGAREVMTIRPGASIRDVVWVNKRHHPPVVMTQEFMDRVTAAADKTTLRKERP